MLTTKDFLHLPFTPDLTEGGIEYALRSLSYIYEKAGGNLYSRLRRTIANVSVELAFRRYLATRNIEFEVKASRPFTDSERYNVHWDTYRCQVISFFISNRNQISDIKQNSSVLLNAPALVPSNHHTSSGQAYNDLYIFAFATGLITASYTDLQKAIAKHQSHYLVHIMPETWRKPTHRNPLGTLTLKSESEEELMVEINGQDENRRMKRKIISLAPKVKFSMDESYYSVTSLHTHRVADARVGIKCETIKKSHIISPFDWSNIWVYGMEIFLCGFMAYEEFRQQAKMVLPNSKTFQYETTRVKNLFIPISNLKPIENLFGKI